MHPRAPAGLTDRLALPLLLWGTVLSYLVAAVLLVLDGPLVLRGPAVLWAAIGVPAIVAADRVRAEHSLHRWVIGLAVSVSVVMLLSQVLLYLGRWSPGTLLLLTGFLTGGAVLADRKR